MGITTKYKKVLMNTAQMFAGLSQCERLKVGAVLSIEGRIIACGYNGTIKDTCNNCEVVCKKCIGGGKFVQHNKGGNGSFEDCTHCQGKGVITNPYVVHAEQNIITFCAKHGLKTRGCELYVTTAPCVTCAKLIVSSGIIKVYYKSVYRDKTGVELLENIGVEVEQLK